MIIIKNRGSLFGRLMAALVCIQTVMVQAAVEFYVAPDGLDGNVGTVAQPFATLERARDAVRELKKKAGGLKDPVAISLRGGTYHLPRTLILSPEDSGTETCPITWQGMSNETAVIDGGERISSSWSSSDGKIYSTIIPGAREGNWHFRQLFVDGHREVQARYPNFIPNDEKGLGQLYVGSGCQILMGLAAPGDWVAYPFEVKAAGDYVLWIGCATTVSNAQKRLAVMIDDQPVPLNGEITRSADWRTVRYSHLANISLGAGEHSIRLISNGAKVHVSHLVLTSRLIGNLEGSHGLTAIEPGEQRITIQAENTAGRTGYSSSGFTTAPAETGQKLDRETIITEGKIKASWTNDPEAIIDLVPGLHYFNASVSIDSIDPVKGLIKIKGSECQEIVKAGSYFYVKGVREELDEPGEWYLDSRSGRLDYWPRAGKNPNQSEVIAPRLDRLLELKGDAEGTDRVRWVQIKNLTFRHCADTLNHVALRTPTDGALKLDCACNCKVEGCVFENIDGFGIWLHLDSCENTITGNTIRNMGAGGVLLTSARLGYGTIYDPRPAVANYAPLRNVFTRNLIHDGGQIRICAAGILMDSRPDSTACETGNLIVYNEIYHMERQGIFGFRNQGGNIVAYNHFHDLLLNTLDAGAVNFATMNIAAAPNLIINNLLHDVHATWHFGPGKSKRYLGIGIYLDHATSHAIVRNNVVYNATTGWHNNGGQFNLIENNIFADLCSQGFSPLTFMDSTRGNRLVHNIVTTRPNAPLIEMQAWGLPSDRMAAVTREIKHDPRRFFDFDDNLYWSGGANVKIDPFGTWASWQATGEDAHSLVADPLFVDPEHGDYSLQSRSPAFRGPGFQPIDSSNTGLHAQAPDKLDLGMTAREHHVVKNGLTNESTARFDTALKKPGNYCVYARIPGRSPTSLSIRIAHAKGETLSSLSEWMPSAMTSQSGWIYLGTYPFNGNATVTFETSKENVSQFPREILLMEDLAVSSPAFVAKNK